MGDNPIPIPIVAKLEAETYVGDYTLEKGMIRVCSGMGEKRTQVGDTPPDVLAKMLLLELAGEGKASKKRSE